MNLFFLVIFSQSYQNYGSFVGFAYTIMCNEFWQKIYHMQRFYELNLQRN